MEVNMQWLSLLLVPAIFFHSLSLLMGASVWWLDLFTHFQLQWVILLALLLALAVSVDPHWWHWGALLYLALLVLWIWPSQFATNVTAGPIDLYYQNVQITQSSEQANTQAGYIVRQPAKTIALVEPSNNLIAAISVERGDPIVYHPDPFGLSCAVWHEHPAEVLAADVITSADHDPICVVSFTEYDLILIHPLPPFGADRAQRQQVTFAKTKALIQASISNQRDWLVVGDFNSTDFSPVFRKHFREYTLARSYTWRWPLPVTIPIDYAFGSLVTDTKKLPAIGSDHQALGVTLQL